MIKVAFRKNKTFIGTVIKETQTTIIVNSNKVIEEYNKCDVIVRAAGQELED